jgi:Fe-S-cluster containining protein
MIQNNENTSLCSGCGKCCKWMPGIVSPSDLKEITVESLAGLFKAGYQFDYWEGNLTGNPEHEDLTFYYLRPQTKKSVGKVVDGSWGGECVFLTESGCSKAFEERPSQCKALIPSENRECHVPASYEKSKMILEWLPYNEIISKTIDKIYEEQ